MSEDCKQIEYEFYRKFGCHPIVTFEEVSGYGANFLLWKKPTMGGSKQIMFYKIGKSLETALWFIDLWRNAPSALALYENKSATHTYSFEIEKPELIEGSSVEDHYGYKELVRDEK